ncbi:MAG: SRPBCC domain-containing protein, partial [Myxococcota bacterium]
MSVEELRVSSLISASPNRIYQAWMDERRHTAFTGRRATVEQWVGGRLTASDGFIEATHVQLDMGRRIVLRWRTAEFPEKHPDSQVEVRLDPAPGGTKVVVYQTGIPEGLGAGLKKIWRSVYLDPMRRFFSSTSNARRALKEATRKGMMPTPGARPRRRPVLGEEDLLPPPSEMGKKPTKKKAAKKKAPPKKAAKKKTPPKKAAKKKAPPKKAAKKKAPPKKAAKK